MAELLVLHRNSPVITSFTKFSNRSVKLLRIKFVPTYPFQKLGKATVVDIGGSHGTDAMLLAEKYPNLDFIIQDLPPMIANADAALQGRIKFMLYSFFTPPTSKSNAYLTKQCVHNWPDQYCVRISNAQIPVMRPGTKNIIIDSLIPALGTMSPMAERMTRAFDMLMLTQTNGREREAEEWKALFQEADSRFKVTSMHPLASPVDSGPAMGIIEVVWDG